MGKRYVRRALFDGLWRALGGTPRLLQVVTGPRQVGKTTLVLEVHDRWPGPRLYASADQPDIPGRDWIAARWEEGRALARSSRREGLLILDEIQKIPRWSETVKRLWDEDRRRGRRLRIVLLGSSALLVQRGLTESLAGRFELHRHPHWGFSECHKAFRLPLEGYWIYGGYPAGLAMRRNPVRWARYIRDSVIETVIGKDVLLMSPVQKPALLRQVFGIACAHPAEILSYQKMLGQLADAGNATTVAHHLHLLASAFLLTPLSRWSGNRLRQRVSTPKLVIRDNSLVSSMNPSEFFRGRVASDLRGRLVENAVGAALVVQAEQEGGEVFYWRDRQNEADFVFRRGSRLLALEVKSGRSGDIPTGLLAFKRRYPHATIAVMGDTAGTASIPSVKLERFFGDPSAVLDSLFGRGVGNRNG